MNSPAAWDRLCRIAPCVLPDGRTRCRSLASRRRGEPSANENGPLIVLMADRVECAVIAETVTMQALGERPSGSVNGLQPEVPRGSSRRKPLPSRCRPTKERLSVDAGPRGEQSRRRDNHGPTQEDAGPTKEAAGQRRSAARGRTWHRCSSRACCLPRRSLRRSFHRPCHSGRGRRDREKPPPPCPLVSYSTEHGAAGRHRHQA